MFDRHDHGEFGAFEGSAPIEKGGAIRTLGVKTRAESQSPGGSRSVVPDIDLPTNRGKPIRVTYEYPLTGICL